MRIPHGEENASQQSVGEAARRIKMTEENTGSAK
jgi:hypothetical protein